MTFYWTQGTKRLNLLALTQKYHKGLSKAVVLVLTGYIWDNRPFRNSSLMTSKNCKIAEKIDLKLWKPTSFWVKKNLKMFLNTSQVTKVGRVLHSGKVYWIMSAEVVWILVFKSVTIFALWLNNRIRGIGKGSLPKPSSNIKRIYERTNFYPPEITRKL